MQELKINGIYKHFKGDYYLVEGIAKDSETQEEMVIYRRLYEDGNYYTPSKKAKFHFEDIAENPTQTSEEFPYIFNSGRGTVGQWHTGSLIEIVKL